MIAGIIQKPHPFEDGAFCFALGLFGLFEAAGDVPKSIVEDGPIGCGKNKGSVFVVSCGELW